MKWTKEMQELLEIARKYSALILAILVAASYLSWRLKHRKRERAAGEAARYVCGLCGERDCVCRREPPAGPPEEGA